MQKTTNWKSTPYQIIKFYLEINHIPCRMVFKRKIAIVIVILHSIASLSFNLSTEIDADGETKTNSFFDIHPFIAKEISKKVSVQIKRQRARRLTNIKFFLYNSKKVPSKWELITTGKSLKLKSQNLKIKKPFKIAIHGFLSSCTRNADFPLKMFQAYTSRKSDYNLICVDWGPLANPPAILQITALLHYPKAVENTLLVGETIEKFIQVLLTEGYLRTSSDVHLIGHSLGSHIAGVSGHQLFAHKKLKIGRITGLDPAGIFFYEKGKEDKCKLGTSDANFVDIIHTNMGKLGTTEMLGHVNFIPNGGESQPFCEKANPLENVAEQLSGICSHGAAQQIFTKSIRENITSCFCKSWNNFNTMDSKCKTSILFGDKTPSTSRGTYCLHVKTL